MGSLQRKEISEEMFLFIFLFFQNPIKSEILHDLHCIDAFCTRQPVTEDFSQHDH